MDITKDTTVEKLIEEHPEANGFMLERGLGCLMCGEPFWGTIEELAKTENLTDEEITALIEELNEFIESEQS